MERKETSLTGQTVDYFRGNLLFSISPSSRPCLRIAVLKTKRRPDYPLPPHANLDIKPP